jgi:hypothetical protein
MPISQRTSRLSSARELKSSNVTFSRNPLSSSVNVKNWRDEYSKVVVILSWVVKQSEFQASVHENRAKLAYGDVVKVLLSFPMIAAAFYFFVVVPVNSLVVPAARTPLND